MNKLEQVIVDQHSRIKSLSGDPREALREMQGEIMTIASPELTLEIMGSNKVPERETRSVNAQLRSFDDNSSVGNRLSQSSRIAHKLAEYGILKPGQGYMGGLVFDGEDVLVHGHSMVYGKIAEDDPIQDAMGETFYPPMMWVKAIRAEAYRNRPESARFLSVAEYLAELGLSLGSMITEYGDVQGATGFMPGERLESLSGVEHVQAEPIEAFRLSGLCDQGVVDPIVFTDTYKFAEQIIEAGGSLN